MDCPFHVCSITAKTLFFLNLDRQDIKNYQAMNIYSLCTAYNWYSVLVCLDVTPKNDDKQDFIFKYYYREISLLQGCIENDNMEKGLCIH